MRPVHLLRGLTQQAFALSGTFPGTTVNVKRGLLRLWVLLTGIWTIALLALASLLEVGNDLLPWFGLLIVPPVALFALGSAVLWVIDGFRTRPQGSSNSLGEEVALVADNDRVIEQDTPNSSGQFSANWVPLLRDTILVWCLTFAGGFLMGVVGISFQTNPQVYGAVGILLGTCGFTIAGLLAPKERWKHLALLYVVVSLTSVINIPLGYTTFRGWVLTSLVGISLMALAGWGLSSLITWKSTKQAP